MKDFPKSILSAQEPKLSDNDVVANFHNASVDQAKAFQMMHSSFIKSSQQVEKLTQENRQMADKILNLTKSKGKKDE